MVGLTVFVSRLLYWSSCDLVIYHIFHNSLYCNLTFLVFVPIRFPPYCFTIIFIILGLLSPYTIDRWTLYITTNDKNVMTLIQCIHNYLFSLHACSTNRTKKRIKAFDSLSNIRYSMAWFGLISVQLK